MSVDLIHVALLTLGVIVGLAAVWRYGRSTGRYSVLLFFVGYLPVPIASAGT